MTESRRFGRRPSSVTVSVSSRAYIERFKTHRAAFWPDDQIPV